MDMEKPITVLVIEDSPSDAHVIVEMFRIIQRPPVQLDHVERLEAALLSLRGKRFDAALLDLNLPDSCGLESLTRVHAQAPDLPIIILTGHDDEATALAALRQGAQDYLIKGSFAVGVVLRSVLYAMERKRTECQMAQLQRELVTATECQQRQIAHDLHDGLGQHLTGVALLAKALQVRLKTAKSPAADEAGELVALIVEAQRQVQRLVQGLHPVDVDARGLAATLAKLAEDIGRQAGVACEFHDDGRVELSNNELALNLYCIAREAVHNALKHARAQRIRITLAEHEHGLRLTIEDDGCGLEHASAEGGMGLRSMRYRAESAGAAFTVESTATTGTIVTCFVPRPGGP